MNRRTMLKGLGGISVGLPLLEEMAFSAASTAAKDVPVRAFNVFFGLGIPAPLQKEGYEGVLEPLKPLRDKLLIMRNVDQVRCDGSGINAHFDGATGSFTAMPAGGEAKAGGPSIDQVVLQAHHPDGLPPSMVPTLIGGTYFRRSRVDVICIVTILMARWPAPCRKNRVICLTGCLVSLTPALMVMRGSNDSSVVCSIPWWINTSFTPG